jgi:hypothetical protein
MILGVISHQPVYTEADPFAPQPQYFLSELPFEPACWYHVIMKFVMPAFIAVLLLLCDANGEAGTIVRDFSGDAMQRYDSRMMNSPLQRISPVLGLSYWPFISYPPAPSLTVVNIQINMPTSPSATPILPARPTASPKFWVNRCGVFVEIEVSPTTNLMEEEQTSCSH